MTDLFSKRGQPAFSPWRLPLVTVMQFVEGLSDRQAAEAVRARIDWKYALSLELTDTGFDFSILSEFRQRLLLKGQESKLLDKMLECFREKQLLKAQGKQRTDSTHIISKVRHLSRLESVVETLRATLNDLAEQFPHIHLVDAGYPENDWVLQSLKAGIRVVEPARPNYHWQAKVNQGFALKDFVIDWDKKEVLCPGGKIGRNWSPSKSGDKEKYRVRFKSSDCLNCPKREDCTKSKRWRVVSFVGKETQEFLEKSRNEETSQEWQKLYQERAGIEGTISQSVRGYGLRQTRYVGKQKTHLHNLATASAVNVVRGVAWLEGKKRETTRVSRFAKLASINH